MYRPHIGLTARKLMIVGGDDTECKIINDAFKNAKYTAALVSGSSVQRMERFVTDFASEGGHYILYIRGWADKCGRIRVHGDAEEIFDIGPVWEKLHGCAKINPNVVGKSVFGLILCLRGESVALPQIGWTIIAHEARRKGNIFAQLLDEAVKINDEPVNISRSIKRAWSECGGTIKYCETVVPLKFTL